MGASESLPGTPVPRPLARVSDPRSPSAGILRTPIEVMGSPAAGGPAEPAAGAAQERDPRSPTPGISRTPLRAALNDSVESLVKQLGEALGAAQPAEEPAPRSPPRAEAAAAPGAERERAPARPARPAGTGTGTGTGTPFSAGSKPVRRKTSSKIMVTSGGTGRSPLSILQDDNSPSALAPRQGKRHLLGENLGDRKEVTVDLSRSLKSGSCTWSDLNKENQQCSFVEN